MNGDRISKLPEVLILQILSLLPTKSAVATSVLSKEWQFLWKMMPKLRFDSCDHRDKIGTFSNNVCKTLLSHKAPVLESLHLKFTTDSCDATEIGIWIGIAYAQHMHKLVLDVVATSGFSKYTLPRSLFNCEILETLTLKGSVNVNLGAPFQVCLKSLKTLHLHPNFYIDSASFVNLLSGCPSFENLLVHPRQDYMMESLTISVPSLQRLSIYDYVHRDYVINVPSLTYLEIEGNCCQWNRSHKFSLIENLTTLVEANIIDVCHIINKKLLRSLTSVKRLSLELAPYEYHFLPAGHLELKTSTKEWWNLLTFILSSSPKLQVLKLISVSSSQNQRWRDGYKSKGNWKQPTKMPKCLLHRLETFMWEGYNKLLVKVEKKMAKYILENAYHLKRATFSLMSFEDGGKLIKDLERMEWASASCERIFE